MAIIDNPSKTAFNNVLYTGTGSSQNIAVGFQPDMTWVKNRIDGNSSGSGTHNHRMINSVTGRTQLQSSNLVNVGADSSYFGNFHSNGFNVYQAQDTNIATGTFASWSWKAGTSFSNDAGANGASIASTGSVNTASRFSIVEWTPTDTSTPETIYHGLGVKPDVIFVKNIERNVDWAVYDGSIGATYGLKLNTTATKSDDNGFWEDTEPTSSIFTTGNGASYTTGAATEKFIAYCWASVPLYSKFNKYVGNASTDGTFVQLDFSPALVIVKKTAGTGAWFMKDSKLNPFNPAEATLATDSASSSAGWGAGDDIDLLSNGFKMRDDTANINTNGDTYMYMAWAATPFVTSSGVPATAR